MSRTNVVLDDNLVEQCQNATGIKTKKSLIDFALHEVLRHENQKKLLELKGNVDWEGDLAAWRKGRLA
jgi:Arc/MetJ family transcription regulator